MEGDYFFNLFGRVFIASGGLGIDGKGYYYDKLLNFVPGHSFEGATFIAKTVTVAPRDGNLPLKENLQPYSRWPKCIQVFPFSGSMMNAVGVSSPGLESVLNSGVWYKRTEPFLISIIPEKRTLQERISEIKEAARLISANLYLFQAAVGIQLNISCPNTEVNLGQYMEEVQIYIDILAKIGLMIDLKISLLTPPEYINMLYNYEVLTVGNAIPFGSMPGINWKKYKGLEMFGGGGLTGPLLLPRVVDWIERFRQINTTKSIKACGGIFSKKAVDKVIDTGANAIEIGTVKLMRPWRVVGLIKKVQEELDENVLH